MRLEVVYMNEECQEKAGVPCGQSVIPILHGICIQILWEVG